MKKFAIAALLVLACSAVAFAAWSTFYQAPENWGKAVSVAETRTGGFLVLFDSGTVAKYGPEGELVGRYERRK